MFDETLYSDKESVVKWLIGYTNNLSVDIIDLTDRIKKLEEKAQASSNVQQPTTIVQQPTS